MKPYHALRVTPVNHSHRRLKAFDLYGLPQPDLKLGYLPFFTPFAMPSAIVRDLLKDARTRFRRPVLEVIYQSQAFEFMLLDAFLMKNGVHYEEIYALRSENASLTFWETAPLHGEKYQTYIKQIDLPEIYCFGLHRKVFAKMPAHFKAWVVSVWLDRGIISSPAEAVPFLESPRLPDV